MSCDDLDELYLFGQYMNRLGNLERNAGEASVLAWAEAHSAAAYVDDQVACNVGRGRGVRVHRTLQLVISACALVPWRRLAERYANPQVVSVLMRGVGRACGSVGSLSNAASVGSLTLGAMAATVPESMRPRAPRLSIPVALEDLAPRHLGRAATGAGNLWKQPRLSHLARTLPTRRTRPCPW